jgi:ribosome-associated protein
MEFDLGPSPYIELIRLLKATNVAESGAQAKQMVEEGLVEVDGEAEFRKRAKIRSGQTVKIFDMTITIK